MVLKSTSTRGNGGAKTDRSDAHPGIESSNELDGRERNSFFGFLENILERVLKYSKDRAKEPEQDSEAKKREEFMNSQYRMLSSIENLDEVIAKRKEYGLSITPAAQDYLDFVQGRDGVTDAWQLSHRAAYSLEDQIDAEDKGNDNFLDRLYDEGKLGAFTDKKKNTKELYRDMTQEEYNAWRAKAADETREFMNKMDKKLADNPDYRPDTLNSVLEYRLHQVFKNSNIDNLRENLENQFYGELVGSNLVVPGGDMFPISTFANFQNGLIAAGLLTPKDDFINKHEASYDLYQENYKEYSEAMLEKRIISNIAQDKELLRAEDFDALIEKSNNDAFKKEMNVFKTLKENFNLSGRNREIYRNKLDNFIENYSTNFIYGIYGTTRENVRQADKIRGAIYENWARGFERVAKEIKDEDLGSFLFKDEAGELDANGDDLKYEIGVKIISRFKTAAMNFLNYRETAFISKPGDVVFETDKLSDVSKRLEELIAKDRDFSVSHIEKGKKAQKIIDDLFPRVYNYPKTVLNALGSDFDKRYKESNRQKDLRVAEKKALSLYSDIKNGSVNLGNLYSEIDKRFGEELKNYDEIEWRANPFATTMLKAAGTLAPDLTRADEAYFEEAQKQIVRAGEELGIVGLHERLSLSSMITNKDPNMKNLLALLANDYDPKLKEMGKDTHNYMEEIDNPYSRRAIIGNFSESDYPRGAYDSLKKLVNFDRDNGLIEGLEKGTTTLGEFANKHGDEYKKLLEGAKESLKENFLALSKGFPTRVDYNNYLISNSHIEPEKVIEAVKEAGKKVIDVNPKFLDDVASGKHQELLKKLAEQIKEEYPNKKNVKKLLEEVFEKGAEQTIVDKGLDGRTKEARFIKEVDKKIKEVGELSM